MAGEVRKADEYFTLSGTEYHFMFPDRGAIGMASSSPFAPKTTTGERSYADYDTLSYMSMADFSGGIGQEEFKDVSKYQDGLNVDTRGGRIAPRPSVIYYTNGLESYGDSTTYFDVRGDNVDIGGSPVSYTKIARRFVARGTGNIYRIWLPLRITSSSETAVQVRLYDQSGGVPGNELAGTTLWLYGIQETTGWFEAIFSSPASVTAGAYYWIAVSQSDTTAGMIGWNYEEMAGTGYPIAYETGGTWTAYDSNWQFYAETEVAQIGPDRPMTLLPGLGEDNIPRVWGWAGRGVYWLNPMTTTIVPAQESSAAKMQSYDITDAVWFRGDTDTYASLYLGFGADGDIVTFDGNVGTEQWTTVTGHKARRLAVHDNMLWAADADGVVTGFDGTTWGASATVGDKLYTVNRMVSWQGYLYVCKANGVFRVSYATGYPASGALTVSQVLDFTSQADQPNCHMAVVHQDDLIFSLSQGLMRYTRGNVLTAIAPDVGLEKSSSTRTTFVSGAPSISTLWTVAQGRLSEYSSLLAWDEGKWHAVYSVSGAMLGSVVLEPGYFRHFDAPTLHFSQQLTVGSMQMPPTTRRTWIWDGMTFSQYTGTLYTSWFDGGIRVIEKDWINCLIDVAEVGTVDLGTIDVYWRPDEDTAWVQLGTQITTSGLQEFSFPSGSHSYRMQLRVDISGGTDGCLMVRALVTGYMERPDDLRTYTRTYRLATEGKWRNGTPFTSTLAEQVESMRTLRSAAEPLVWYPWYGGSRNVHIVNYNGVEAPEEQRPAGDIGSIVVTVQLVEI